jgi:hypothetical protein
LGRQVSVDVPVATVLTELERQKLVAVDGEEGGIRLVADGFVAQPGSLAALEAFDKNLAAHLDAAIANLTAEDGPPHLERAIHYSHLCPASVQELEAKARDLATEALTQLNREALARQERDADASDAVTRFSFGTYLHSGRMDPPPSDEDE